MKNTFYRFRNLCLVSVVFFAACNDADKTTTTTDSTTTTMDTTAMTTPVTNPEQETINELVPGNANEIAWIQAALDNKSSSKALKDHARMMLADHKKLGTAVSDLVAKKNWSMPSVDTTGAVTINDKTGKDWDNAWTEKMVADHAALLDKLTQAEAKVTDADLKTLITNTKPVVQKHLDMAKMMQGKQ